MMSVAEKENVRNMYFLDDDDEPPYMLKSKMGLIHRIGTAQQKRKAWGLTELAVHIDSEGNPTAVTVFATPDPELTKWMSALFLMERYEPGLCQGKPCAMLYPFRINNTADF